MVEDAFTTSQFGAFTSVQTAGFTSSQLDTMTSDDLAAISTTAFRTLTTNALAALETAGVMDISLFQKRTGRAPDHPPARARHTFARGP